MKTTLSDFIFGELKQLLMSEDFKNEHRNSARSFIRNRVAGFAQIVGIQINRLVKSLSVELIKFLNLIDSNKTYSKQAFSKARHKLKHTAFIALNEQYIQHYYTKSPLKLYDERYLLLAVDGSSCQMPESSDLASHFGRWKNDKGEGMVMGHLSVVYDLLNRMVINGMLSPNNVGETAMFYQQFELLKQQGTLERFTRLYLMDRGYPSFELFKTLELAGSYFVLRCKKDFCSELKAFIAEDIEEKEIYLSPRSWDAMGRKRESRYEEGSYLRVVRYLLNTGAYEYLMTNTAFSVAKLGELYNLRWGVETGYSFLKEKMQIENFSSKTKEGVLQDFNACLLTANLVNLLIQEAQEELDKEVSANNKHSYKINANVAIGILRDQILKILFMPTDISNKLEQLKKWIKQNTVVVIPNRSFPRNMDKRRARKYHLPKKKTL